MVNEDIKLWDFHEVDNRGSFEAAKPRNEFLAKEISKVMASGRVLDVGFGSGYLLEILSDKFDICGVDISEANVKKTQEIFSDKKIKADLKVGEIEKIPFPDDYFNIVVSSEVFEHLTDESLYAGIKEIFRVLKPGGVLVGTVPADENLKDNLCYCPKCGNSFHRWGHKQSFDIGKIEKILSAFKAKKISRLTFFGERLLSNNLAAKVKFLIKKIIFGMVKNIFAPQWWYFFVVEKK